MPILKLIFLGLTMITLVACKKDDSLANADPISEKIIYDQAYGTDAKQKMDIYLPANRNVDSTRVIVLIHGGAWTTGDKSEFNTFVDTLRKRLPNYAVFNINYRLSANPLNVFPTQENDVRTVVQYISGKASDYQISKKLVMMGGSAGAHLAMLQGFKDSVPIKTKAIVSFFGPSDMTEMYNNPVGGNPVLAQMVANAVGATPAQNPSIYFSSSPVNYINSASPPTILLHGGLDPLVSASQSVAVSTRLTAAGVTNEYVFYPTGGHGDWSTATYTDAFNKIQAFLIANVH